MQESIEEYAGRIAAYSRENLKSIALSIDQEKNPQRYAAVLAEIQKRKDEGTWISEPVEESQRYRTLVRRMLALIIDGLIFLVISLLVASPFSQLQQMLSGGDMRKILLPYMVKIILIQSVYLAYVIFFHWRFGATFGKMAMGIQVVDFASEGRIRLSQAVLRETVPVGVLFISIGQLLYYRNSGSLPTDYSRSLNGLWSWAEILTALFSPKRRAIHDRIAKTICVKV